MKNDYITRALHLDYDAYISSSIIKSYMLIKHTVKLKDENLEAELILNVTNKIKDYFYFNCLTEIDYFHLFEIIRKTFKGNVESDINTLTIGQTQLWINSFICLLNTLNYEFDNKSNTRHLEEINLTKMDLDIPLDDEVFKFLVKEILEEEINEVNNTWIEINDYSTYMFFQDRIRKIIVDEKPIDWYMKLLFK